VQPTYDEIFDTLGLQATQQLELDKTLAGKAIDWRDTLRESLPLLPLSGEKDTQFQIRHEIGRGGMGLVHLAFQNALGRDVAIKTVHSGEISRDTENALLQEARVMGAVEHPNVVPIHVIGQDESGRPVIVMKRIQGVSWESYFCGQTPVPSEDEMGFHLNIFLSVCNAMSFAHSRGILHRDIKPENVMVGQFGEVYLLDWGLAAALVDMPRIPKVSDLIGVVGTPVFMAPEMTTGDNASQGIHTDIFLLGGLLHTVATGEPPNRGATLFEVMSFSYTGQKRIYPDGVPDELVDICERALAHTPGDRYKNADELKTAVEAFLSHRNSHALVNAANERTQALTLALESDDSDVDALFAEVRFAFMSALQIWRQNPEALRGLQSCLKQMIIYRAERGDFRGATALLSELPDADDALRSFVEERASQASANDVRLAKIAYDYDESVGIHSRQWIVALMAATFALAPVVLGPMASSPVPALFRGITEVPLLFWSNAVLVAFTPALVALNYFTFTRYRDHKASRIFSLGMTWMFVLAVGIRTSTLWTGLSLSHAAAAETAMFSSGLMMLGLAIDRRLGRPGWWYAMTSLALVMAKDYPVEIYSLGSFIACASFLYAGPFEIRPPWQPRE
jgi:serine/threonine protein kinase